MSDEYKPDEVFQFYNEGVMKQQSAVNYLILRLKWSKRSIAKLEKQLADGGDPATVEREIAAQREELEKLQDYIDVINGEWVNEDDVDDTNRIQLHLYNSEIGQLFRALKAFGVIGRETTASDFSRHFRNKRGERLNAGFINSDKPGAPPAENDLVRLVKNEAMAAHPEFYKEPKS